MEAKPLQQLTDRELEVEFADRKRVYLHVRMGPALRAFEEIRQVVSGRPQLQYLLEDHEKGGSV